ncbi:MAG: EAL domain-containing protein [Kineosporiaceae bacterium]
MATAGLAVVLLAVSGFSLWASQSTARSAQRAVAASRLSDDFAQASKAVAAAESVERKYRLEPGPEVRAAHDQAAADLVVALDRVRADGDASDVADVERILAAHGPYLVAVHRLFAAVDRGDHATVLRVDSEDVDPRSEVIQEILDEQSRDHHREALQALASLHSLESFTSTATPIVLLVGLLLVALFSSVLRRVQLQRPDAVYDSRHDALTGLPNRALLADRFDQALLAGRERGTSTGLLLIDLDRFKEVNDTLGHHVGDQLLIQIGPRLRRALREVDTVARLGGDEFAILLPGIDAVEDAVAVARHLRAELQAPFQVGSLTFHVEASIGAVISGEHGDDASTLLKRADVAMYVAKGQNLGVSAYDQDADGHSPERLALLPDLRRALDNGELVLHFQPQLALSTGVVCGAEALVRWNHPTRGQLAPDAFLPLAEHTGLIGPLTRCVLDLALAQARRWMDAGQRLQMSVNLSARNLLDDQLDVEVAELLQTHRVPAELLMLEVAESAIMAEPVRAAEVLGRLHDLGVRISIDDFGAGYTSLGQLKNLPIDELKVDRSFVITMAEDRSNQLIVRSVVDLGHNLGLRTVAEGVETAGALDALTDYGCDIAQGYHMSRPLPVEEFDRWRSAREGAPDAEPPGQLGQLGQPGVPAPRRPEPVRSRRPVG